MKLFLITTTPERFHIARGVRATHTACKLEITTSDRRNEIGRYDGIATMGEWTGWCKICKAELARLRPEKAK